MVVRVGVTLDELAGEMLADTELAAEIDGVRDADTVDVMLEEPEILGVLVGDDVGEFVPVADADDVGELVEVAVVVIVGSPAEEVDKLAERLADGV